MTKSRQSGIKLRLSRLIKCLLALGCIKLGIMAAGILDLPMPSWKGADNKSMTVEVLPAEIAQPVVTHEPPELNEPTAFSKTNDEPLPQGVAAAELAAAAKPKRSAHQTTPALPAPLVTAGPANLLGNDQGYYNNTLLPEPEKLDAPLAAAGVVLPDEKRENSDQADDNVWNMLDLKSLPIPGLGSVQAAQAASLDMPVPNAPKTVSPFAPAEQVAPLGGQPRVIPGAPPFPANIPNAQPDVERQLVPRQATIGNSGGYSPLPSQQPLTSAPAPTIQAQPMALDPNVKAQELARQQQDILMLRQQMDQRLKDLQIAEEKMKDMLKQANDAEEKKVKSLVQMYANMKPRMAAQALENMDERIAVRILSGMAPKQSGEILTYTNPAKTAKLTEMITRLRMAE